MAERTVNDWFLAFMNANQMGDMEAVRTLARQLYYRANYATRESVLAHLKLEYPEENGQALIRAIKSTFEDQDMANKGEKGRDPDPYGEEEPARKRGRSDSVIERPVATQAATMFVPAASVIENDEDKGKAPAAVQPMDIVLSQPNLPTRHDPGPLLAHLKRLAEGGKMNELETTIHNMQNSERQKDWFAAEFPAEALDQLRSMAASNRQPGDADEDYYKGSGRGGIAKNIGKRVNYPDGPLSAQDVVKMLQLGEQYKGGLNAVVAGSQFGSQLKFNTIKHLAADAHQIERLAAYKKKPVANRIHKLENDALRTSAKYNSLRNTTLNQTEPPSYAAAYGGGQWGSSKPRKDGQPRSTAGYSTFNRVYGRVPAAEGNLAWINDLVVPQ